MTVGELISALMKHDAEHRVVVQGYEEGFDDVLPPRSVTLELDVHAETWHGPHDSAPGGVPAVYLAGRRRSGVE